MKLPVNVSSDAAPVTQAGARVPATSPPPPSLRFLRLREVCSLTTLGKSSIYARMKDPGPLRFPAPVVIGPRCVAWRERDVVAWLEARQARETWQ